MNTIIPDRPISGMVTVPESKSYAHRYLIAGCLSAGCGNVNLLNRSDDVMATKEGIEAIINADAGQTVIVNCHDSGTTFRFLLPIAAALGKDTKFMISQALSRRPSEPLYEALMLHGASIKELDYEEEKCVRIREKLFPGDFEIPGYISSQFISGLMFALPLLPGQSTITVKGRIRSKSYVDMTKAVLEEAGIEIIEEQPDDIMEDVSVVYRIPGNQTYALHGDRVIEGDWSAAAVWLAAGALSGPVTCCGLNMDSLQGDRRILDILEDFGADVKVEEDRVTVSRAPLKGIQIDLADNPDLVPEVELLSLAAEGETKIASIDKVRFRETGRIKTAREILKHLEIDKDRELIEMDCFGDHRLAMMAAVSSCIASKPIMIKGSEAVNKSYPGFFKDLSRLTEKI